MQERVAVTLECCQIRVEMIFDRKEAPGLPEGHFRKNVDCPKCHRLVIVSLEKTGDQILIEQEVIRI